MGWKLVTGITLGLYVIYKCFFEEDKDKRSKTQPTYYSYTCLKKSVVVTPRTKEVPTRIVYLSNREIPFWKKHVKNNNEVSSYTYQSWPEILDTIEGTDDNGKIMNKIEMYSIPENIMDILEKNLKITSQTTSQEREAIEDFIIKFTNIPNVKLSFDNFNVYTFYQIYQIFFHDMLYIEEYESITKMKKFNMYGVTMKINKDQEECTLDVPGLAEKRPNILKNDVIYVRLQKFPTVQYSGLVKEVLKESIVIKGFDSSLLNYLSSTKEPALLDVRFTCSRYSFYIQHLAVDLMSSDTLQVLHPGELKLNSTYQFSSYSSITTPISANPNQANILHLVSTHQFLVNPSIETNAEQLGAVLSILLKTSKAPYIIFGPPGTGKTATFVEAILQVKKRISYSHILVCAQNNGTCDQIASKLYSSGECSKLEIVRLISSSRLEETDLEISDITFSYQGKEIDKIKNFRIIVCTLITAGRIVEDNMYIKNRYRRGGSLHSFSHLFIDEAGQATETQTLVPIAGLLEQGGQVVLAGDPKQLGPVCSGKMSERFGICSSFLERLMRDSSVYKVQNGQYDVRFITQLVKNYRSHEDILKVPNKLFYENKLKPQGIRDELCFAPLNEISRKKQGKSSQERGSPIIFHGVRGQEERDPKSLSMWNKKEISTVIEYISRLFLCDIEDRVTQKDIGVIAPYFLQVQKIKQELRKHGWEDIETGCTETFQGREKRVIIVSTVRSQANKVGYYPIGFVKDPRRFNVIMTRAQAKLIVIGNPYALSQDENWRYFIETVVKSGAYRGCDFDSKDEDLRSDFENLHIDTQIYTPSTSTGKGRRRRRKNKN